MKIMILFIIISLALGSCRKTDNYKAVDIITDFKDDVSPVLVEFSIGGEYDHVDWTFEEKYSPSEDSPSPAYHIFLPNTNFPGYKW